MNIWTRTNDQGKAISVVTNLVYPPIPTRQFDWVAIYEGDEPNDDGNIEAGYGRTEVDAVHDLIMNFSRLT